MYLLHIIYRSLHCIVYVFDLRQNLDHIFFLKANFKEKYFLNIPIEKSHPCKSNFFTNYYLLLICYQNCCFYYIIIF